MVRKGVEMIEKRKHYKELVHLGEFKNKLVYYDLKAKKLYFSIPERSYKNQQYVILSLVLLVLPFTEQSLLNADKLFYTENKGRNNKHYGLGLAFAKQVATRHFGELFLSNPDRGGAQVTLLIKK